MTTKKITADEVVTQQHVRGFIQWGHPRPGTPADYYGIRAQYFFVEGVNNPVQGGISPINMPDPQRLKKYRRVGRTIEPPDFGTYDLSVAQKHGTLPRAFGDLAGCPINTYLAAGRCKNPSDLNRGWESYVYILGAGEVTDREPGDMFPMEGDEAEMTALTVVTADQYGVGGLAFGEKAGSEVNAEVLDIAFAPAGSCDGCDAGTSRIYAITRPIGGSPTFQAEVVYSVDGGTSWTNINITGLSAAGVPTAIDVVGDYLVVLVNSTLSHFYTLIDSDTGIPGSTWTQVTSGYVASAGPRDLVVLGPSEVIIVGDGGYVYRATDITAAVTAISAGVVTTASLRRVHGSDEVIVAVGASGTVIFSLDRGASFQTPRQTFPIAGTLTAVAVKDEDHWWVAGGSGAVAGSGRIFYTLNGGKSWVEYGSAIGAAAAIEVQDIVFATDHVGYVAFTTSGPAAVLACSIDGGNTWTTGAQRIVGTFPTADRVNRIGVPVTGGSQTDANTVALAGLAGDGSEGVIFTARADIL